MKMLLLLRTVLTVILLGLMMLAALWACAHWKLPQEFFAAAKDGFVALAAIAATKSSVEHLANGGGLMGGLKVLFTNAKPAAEPAAIQP